MSSTLINRDVERIQCLEVWGGNVRVEKQLQVTGLDIWLASRPLGEDEAGGDVYYISSCAAGRLTRILLADVSGHGQRVARIAEQLRDLMEKNIEKADHRQLVADMNRQFEASSEADSYATAVVISFTAPTRSLLLSSAGHPAPLVYRAAVGRWQYLDHLVIEDQSPKSEPVGLPLGILPHTDYEQRKGRLNPGDVVLCYTDAFTEARRANGSLLGTAGLLELVAAASPFADGAELIARITDSVKRLHPENLRHDDATLVAFCATGVRFRLRDQLTTPFRFLFTRPSEVCSIGKPQERCGLQGSGCSAQEDQRPETGSGKV